MKQKKKFETPRVIKIEHLHLETAILQPSAVDDTSIQTDGQEKDGFYEDGSGFNFTWGE